MFLFARLARPRTAAAKLYCMAALSLLAILVLAGSATHFSRRTEQAAHRLYDEGLRGFQAAARLELLFTQHRRIVEAVPAELDLERLYIGRDRLRTVHDEIRRALSETDAGTDAEAILLRDLTEAEPELRRHARQIYFFGENFAQDKALQVVQGPYAEVADRVERRIAVWRQERLAMADREVGGLLTTAWSLVAWVSFGAFAAALIGAISLLVVRDVLIRLGRITGAMRRLANYDTTVEVPSRDDHDELGEMSRAVEVFKQNAIELLQRKADLEQANRRTDAALNNMLHGLCMWDADERVTLCNDRYLEIFNFSPDVVKPGATLREIFEHSVGLGNMRDMTADELYESRRAHLARNEAPTVYQDLADGRTIAIDHRPLPNGGSVATFKDITARRAVEARISHMARHDALTDLPNRVLFRERMEEALSRLRPDESVAVLCLDLDQFKSVNDTLGHPVGDALLKAATARLKECVCETDFIARLGGDEFAIVQVAPGQPNGATALARRLIEWVSAPYELEGHQIIIGASVGIAVAPGDGNEPNLLLRNADMALYRAKAEGRSRFRFFEPEMDARMQARRSLELDLRKALTNGEFELFYQPLVSINRERMTGLEALLRWRHPTRGLISPAEFIPVAEETGLIVPIGEWVLRQACAEAAKWSHDIKIAVNLSPIQFRNTNIVLTVFSALANAHLAPQRLELEITESTLLSDSEATLERLHRLRDLGVRIAMDDFGTGYSSLSYLRSFPFDKIKIDRSFIRDLTTRSDAVAIVRAITSMGASLGISTTAEGVETREQVERLRQEGCTEVQGYFFSPPIPASDLHKLFAKFSPGAEAAA
jgi:diguanylate cyclase (GGDEF)-like protein